MDNSKTVHLKFIGTDSWDRPVYREENGTLWKDLDPRAKTKPNLCTSVNNAFDGEPDTNMRYLKKYKDVTPVFEPERFVWP